MEIKERRLWEKFKNKSSVVARDSLAEQYVPLVKRIARQMSNKLPDHVDKGDIESYGYFGLVDALNKYDLTRGVPFAAYASNRIRGSIYDGLRSDDWLPRSTRTKVKNLEAVIDELYNRLYRSPTTEEIAEELDLTIEEAEKLVSKYGTDNYHMSSLDMGLSEDSDSISIVDTLSLDTDDYADWDMSEFASKIENLNFREKTVFTLYYYECLTLAQIGTVLGITESRVSQIHSKALRTLGEE